MLPIHLTTEQIERFYTKVSKTPTERGCLEWLGGLRNGYGYFGRRWSAHRVAWTLVNGQIPEGMVIAHQCDNPRCCRVEHLFLATQTDNVRDMDAKGRRVPPKGERNSCAKITEQDVAAIRSDLYNGWTLAAIGAQFGIGVSQVSAILRGKNWTHLDEAQGAPHQSAWARGEQASKAKLTESDVIAMRSDLYSGWRQVDIARHFGISRGQVAKVLGRKQWTHV